MKYFCVMIITLMMGACSTLDSILLKAPQLEIEFVATESAYIYKHKETGELIYCSNKHVGNPKDYDYKGTADVKTENIVRCSLAN